MVSSGSHGRARSALTLPSRTTGIRYRHCQRRLQDDRTSQGRRQGPRRHEPRRCVGFLSVSFQLGDDPAPRADSPGIDSEFNAWFRNAGDQPSQRRGARPLGGGQQQNGLSFEHVLNRLQVSAPVLSPRIRSDLLDDRASCKNRATLDPTSATSRPPSTKSKTRSAALLLPPTLPPRNAACLPTSPTVIPPPTTTTPNPSPPSSPSSTKRRRASLVMSARFAIWRDCWPSMT